MNDKERKCINPFCRRILIDEGFPFLCARCRKSGIRFVIKGGKGVLVAGSTVIAIVGPIALAAINSHKDSDK